MARAAKKRPGIRPGKALPHSPAQPRCPSVSDLVVLGMGNPIDSENPLLRGFRRIHADGVAPAGEYVEPYGFVVPKGRALVVTDVAFFSKATKPLSPGSLTRLSLGYLQRVRQGWLQGILFVTTATYTKNRAIGGNVSLNSGVVIPYDRYLTLDLYEQDLDMTEVFVYGYLADA